MRSGIGGSIQSPERLAYWYFRLNGFMSIENFLVHSEQGRNPRTDVDLLATRFAYRRENFETPMEDDFRVWECKTFANVVLAEIKKGRCALNGPWTNPSDKNMERVLRAVGCAKEEEIAAAAQSLYRMGRWANELVTVRLFSLGEETNPDLPIDPGQQIEWASIIDFCIGRFRTYKTQKSSMGQWAQDGFRLKEMALNGDVPGIREYFNLRSSTPLG